jgi:hypothetical protein
MVEAVLGARVHDAARGKPPAWRAALVEEAGWLTGCGEGARGGKAREPRAYDGDGEHGRINGSVG